MKKKYLLLVVLSLLCMTSCSDWLDLKPDDGVVENDYWRNKDDVHLAVFGCYSSLLDKGLVNNILQWGEIRAEIVTGGPAVPDNILKVIRGEISPDNGIVGWGSFYSTINQCNKVIENSIPVMELDQTFTEKLCQQYIAEATTIRGLMYFYLVRSFRDVPLVFKASDNDEQDYNYAKTDGNAILDTIAWQLTKCLNSLPARYEDNVSNKGRVTRWMALALLADIYLWQSKYDACLLKCNEIISSGQYTLVPVERAPKEIRDNSDMIVDTAYTVTAAEMDLWFDRLYVTGNSVESIFEFQYPETHPSLADPFFDLFNSTANRPKLVANAVNLDGIIFPEYELDRSVKDIRSLTYPQNFIWKYVGTSMSSVTHRAERTYPHLIIYRLPDVMLMKAEALTQQAIQGGNDQVKLQEAYSIVKVVRERSNAVENPDSELLSPISGKALEKLILNERAREFLFEGKRWYDILRFARRDSYGGTTKENLEYLTQLAVYSAPIEKVASLQVKYRAEEGNYGFHYWPISVSAIEINKNLKQNEFYAQ